MAACGTYEAIREADDYILRFNCEECTFFPSLEDNPDVMEMAIRALVKEGQATRLVFVQKRDYEYDYEQTQLLLEIAKAYRSIERQKQVVQATLTPECQKIAQTRMNVLQNIITRMLLRDPVGAYVQLEHIEEEEQRLLTNGLITPEIQQCLKTYYELLKDSLDMLNKTGIVEKARPYHTVLTSGDRSIYRKIFLPAIRPDFMLAKLMAAYPIGADEIDNYEVIDQQTQEKTGVDVTLFRLPNSVQVMYHVIPPEFKLNDDLYELLDTAKKQFEVHQPTRSEFLDPQRLRQTFSNLGADLLQNLAQERGFSLTQKQLNMLTSILLRYTVGFGLIEILLQDPNIQDIVINSPIGRTPVFVVHNNADECVTNILPTIPEANSWASKLRLISGRPLDEANPILDTELTVPSARSRVAAIYPPLNPTGFAFALRRHRDEPWTLPLFMKAGYLNAMAAGLISFLVDGNRTLLVAGTRSSGKTSLLGALMVEIMRKRRIVTIEDTLELPIDALRSMNYNIQSMKVASALTRGTTEVTADEGIRTTLRLGDSALIVGEVRSVEARALYESMRVGALANVVAGTIHGDSPYGVYDRVVNDLNVPKTSFKATDIIIVANRVRSADGLRSVRKITQITEVRKTWEEDPLRQGGFVDLMRYDAKKEIAEITSDLLHGDSEILKNIAGTVRDFAGNWDAVWDNITLRANIKQALVDLAEKTKHNRFLEAKFVIEANDEFHMATERVKEETGTLEPQRIFKEWSSWLKEAAKRTLEKEKP
ncbi:MAG: type II/IV secretion system ATPase subunit [Candidatus Aenigmarchaeota archaeon]|nr:type II/IV secretion system ATPase subunit [Candidatus Aenigmarchaeota archaeon]